MTGRGHVTVALWNPKTPANIGGVLRAAGCFGADLVVVAGKRSTVSLRHLPTDTASAWKHIPTIQVDDPFDAMPLGAMPVAVDLVPNATPLPRFVHPERAFYLFGPEDGTLSGKMLLRCPLRVMVPTTQCLNLASCVNVLLYDRMVKNEKAILGRDGRTHRGELQGRAIAPIAGKETRDKHYNDMQRSHPS
jgi:tRNA(Leu) C34 or U34 (ribose-2'-O)-methylase TrmL